MKKRMFMSFLFGVLFAISAGAATYDGARDSGMYKTSSKGKTYYHATTNCKTPSYSVSKKTTDGAKRSLFGVQNRESVAYKKSDNHSTGSFEFSPYISIKGGYSLTNMTFVGDSFGLNISASQPEAEYMGEILGDVVVKSLIQDLGLRVHTNDVWSFNPAIGGNFDFKDFRLATFRLEAEYAYNQDAKNDIPLNVMETSGIMANLYMDFRTKVMFVKPFISAGLGYGRSSFSMLGIGTVSSDMQHPFTIKEWKQNNLIWSVGGGLSLDITDSLALDVQYRYMDYGSVKVDGGFVDSFETYESDEDYLGIELFVDVKNVMHQFMMGLRYTF